MDDVTPTGEPPETTPGEPPLTLQEVTAFARLARGLAVAATVDDLLEVVAHEVLGSLALEEVVVYLVDHQRGRCVPAAAYVAGGDQGHRPVSRREEIPLGEGSVGRVAATGATQLVADRQRRPEVAGDALPGRSLLAVPVKADDLVLAVIASGHHEPAFFTSRHVEVFTAVARFAAPRLNLERLLAEMTRQKEFYERVLDALPTQIGVLSPSGVFEYVNPAAIADAAMRRWIVGKTNADYGARRGLPMEVVAQRVARQQQVTDTGRPVEFRETFRTRDGQQRHYHRYLAPVLDADGTVRHLVSGGGDVTDVRALEARVAALEAELAATRAASGGDAPTAP
jgi:PAS domain-containing protein